MDAALTLARGFLSARDAGGDTAWHIDELPEPLAPALGAELAGGLSDALGTGVAPGSPRPVGAVGTHAAVGVPLGLLTAPMLDALIDASRIAAKLVTRPAIAAATGEAK